MKKHQYQIETLVVGQLQTNCYIVMDMKTKDAVIIDPGDDGSYIAEKVIAFHIHPHAILITHGHFDHILGAYELQEIFKIPVYMNIKDDFLVQRMKQSAEYFLRWKIVEKQPTITPISTKRISFGTIVFDIVTSPGHTPGGTSYLMKNALAVFTGDTLFAHGAVGRTDLSYSKPLDLADSIQKLFKLPDAYVIYPGHGERSTIGKEKALYDNKNNNE